MWIWTFCFPFLEDFSSFLCASLFIFQTLFVSYQHLFTQVRTENDFSVNCPSNRRCIHELKLRHQIKEKEPQQNTLHVKLYIGANVSWLIGTPFVTLMLASFRACSVLLSSFLKTSTVSSRSLLSCSFSFTFSSSARSSARRPDRNKAKCSLRLMDRLQIL